VLSSNDLLQFVLDLFAQIAWQFIGYAGVYRLLSSWLLSGGGLKLGLDDIVEAFPVAGHLDSVELDLGHQAGVFFAVLSLAVEAEEAAEAEVFDVFEPVAKAPPLVLHLWALQVLLFVQLGDRHVGEDFAELCVNLVVVLAEFEHLGVH